MNSNINQVVYDQASIPATETQPLLPTPNQPFNNYNVEVVTWKNVLHQIVQLTKLTLPLTLSMTMLGGFNIVSMSYLGKIGTEALAAAALSMSYLGVTTLTPLMGLMTALDTLISQAHTNPHASKELPSIYLQRAMIISALALIPCLLVLFQFEGIMLYLGQDPDIAALGGRFTKSIAMICYPLMMFHNIRAFLTSQGIVWPFLVTTTLITPIQYLLLKAVIWYELIEDTILVIPIVTTVNLSIVMVVITILGYLSGGFAHWIPFGRHSFSGYGEFLRLGAGGLLLTSAELWCLECFTLFASYLGPTALGVQTIINNCFAIGVFTCLGLQAATTIRIGNLLGSSSPKMAQVTAYVTLTFATGLGVAGWLAIQLDPTRWIVLFTKDPEVIQLCVFIFQYVAITFVFRCISIAASGILRGQGRQGLAAGIHLVIGYLIAIPTGWILTCYFDMGLLGLWVGLAANFLGGSLVQMFFILRTNWNSQVEKANQRVQNSL